jgi:hypothetical protein
MEISHVVRSGVQNDAKKVTLAADKEASAAQMDARVVFKDGSGGRRVSTSSLLGAQEVLAKGNVKRLRSPCSKHVRRSASCGIGERGRKLAGKKVNKGYPLSTLVKVGGRSALGVV